MYKNHYRITACIMAVILFLSCAYSSVYAKAPDAQCEVQAYETAQSLGDHIKKIISVYFDVIDEENGIYEFVYDYENFSGEIVKGYTGAYYNKQTGVIYGKTNQGIFNSGFDVDINKAIAFCPVGAWMQKFGFCRLYDVLAYIIGYRYMTRRIEFSYGGRDWMLQIWKGQYFAGMGGEIGLYEKPEDRIIRFYDCVSGEDMPQFSLDIYDANTVYVSRELQTHWWLNGFALSEMVDNDTITLESNVIFSDSGMNTAFLEALDKYSDEITYTVDENNAIHIVWQ